MIRTRGAGRYRVVTNLRAPTKNFVLSIRLRVIVPEDSTARPGQKIPFVAGNSAIEGEVMFFK